MKKPTDRAPPGSAKGSGWLRSGRSSHHLLDELRVNVDWIARSLGAAVQGDIEAMLVDAHRQAERRLAVAERLYGTARLYQMVPIVAANLRRILAVEFPHIHAIEGYRAKVKTLAEALHRYYWEASPDLADRDVREAWQVLENGFFEQGSDRGEGRNDG